MVHSKRLILPLLVMLDHSASPSSSTPSSLPPSEAASCSGGILEKLERLEGQVEALELLAKKFVPIGCAATESIAGVFSRVGFERISHPDDYQLGSNEGGGGGTCGAVRAGKIEVLYRSVYDSPSNAHLISSVYPLETKEDSGKQEEQRPIWCDLVAVSGAMPGGWVSFSEECGVNSEGGLEEMGGYSDLSWDSRLIAEILKAITLPSCGEIFDSVAIPYWSSHSMFGGVNHGEADEELRRYRDDWREWREEARGYYGGLSKFGRPVVALNGGGRHPSSDLLSLCDGGESQVVTQRSPSQSPLLYPLPTFGQQDITHSTRTPVPSQVQAAVPIKRLLPSKERSTMSSYGGSTPRPSSFRWVIPPVLMQRRRIGTT